LTRDILSWYIKNFKQGNRIAEFRFTDLANWLIDHHRTFIEQFENSHIRKSYRLHTKRSYIKGRLKELINSGFIDNTGLVKAQKNDSDTQLYCFTKQGCTFAWLVETKFSIGDARKSALEMFLSELSDFTATISQSSFAECLVEVYTERSMC
jgi:hypothetical protein